MFRKILFISINFFSDMHIFSKAALLLFFSSVSVVLTIFCSPFIANELNFLELYSNLAVSITLFSGALYVQENIDETLKGFLFLMIIFVNIVFGIFWFWSCFCIFFEKHSLFFFKHFPIFYKNMIAFQESVRIIKFEWNFLNYSTKLYISTTNLKNEYTSKQTSWTEGHITRNNKKKLKK